MASENPTPDTPEAFQLMKPEDVEMYRVFVERKVEQWHALKPDVILLDDASTVPIALAIKECWKRRYPEEKQPRFIRWNPRNIHTRDNIEEHREDAAKRRDLAKAEYAKWQHPKDLEEAQYWDQRIEYLHNHEQAFLLLPRGTRVLVYDEASQFRKVTKTGDGSKDYREEYPTEPVNACTGGVLNPHIIYGQTPEEKRDLKEKIYMGGSPYGSISVLHDCGVRDIWVDVSQPEDKARKAAYFEQVKDPEPGKGGYLRLFQKMGKHFAAKTPEGIEDSKKFVHDLRLLGRQAAQNLLEKGDASAT